MIANRLWFWSRKTYVLRLMTKYSETFMHFSLGWCYSNSRQRNGNTQQNFFILGCSDINETFDSNFQTSQKILWQIFVLNNILHNYQQTFAIEHAGCGCRFQRIWLAVSQNMMRPKIGFHRYCWTFSPTIRDGSIEIDGSPKEPSPDYTARATELSSPTLRMRAFE